MKRLSSFTIYPSIVLFAVLVFLCPGAVEESVYAAADDQVVSGPATPSSPAEATVVSDDFNACTLNTDLWTWTDPRGDATHAITGTFTQDAWLSISVPAGDHNIWEDGNFAARVMQPISDTKYFTIEVKFESPLTQTYQMLDCGTCALNIIQLNTYFIFNACPTVNKYYFFTF